METSIPIANGRRRRHVRVATQRSRGKTKLTLTLDTDTATRLKAHAALRGLELGIAAGLILRPWLVRNGSGRTADEFRDSASLVLDHGTDLQVADHAA